MMMVMVWYEWLETVQFTFTRVELPITVNCEPNENDWYPAMFPK